MKNKIIYSLRNKLQLIFLYTFYYFDIKICKYDSCSMYKLLI